jgi:hypothetical protein
MVHGIAGKTTGGGCASFFGNCNMSRALLWLTKAIKKTVKTS